MPYLKRSVSLKPRIAKEIEDYARANKVTFSKAVSDLCDRALHAQFDKEYAPNIARLINDGIDRAITDLEQVIEIECERASYATVERVREIVNDGNEEVEE